MRHKKNRGQNVHKINYQIRKVKNNQKGATLVEVIVTFALIGLFLLAATTAVSAAMNAFYRMEAISRAIVVSDTILDKAEGELSMASADGAELCLGGEESADGFWSTICFYTANGNPARMKSEDAGDGKGHFSLYYYPTQNGNTAGTDWTFDEKLYQGFWVTELSFRWNGSEESPDNIIEIRLSLTNGTSSYSQSRFVQCTNFFRPSHFSHIHTGELFIHFSAENLVRHSRAGMNAA